MALKSKVYALNKNKYILPSELEKLEYLLESHLEQDHRNTTLLFLALHTGARATELLNIETWDINPHEKNYPPERT